MYIMYHSPQSLLRVGKLYTVNSFVFLYSDQCAMFVKQRGAVTAVMNIIFFVLLFLSGLLCSASGLQRAYHYINKSMTWTEAQRYCRERYTDLATVDSMEDVNRIVNTVNDGYSGSVWIGLQRATQSRWGWSLGNDTITQYSGWSPGVLVDNACAFFANGFWYTDVCLKNLHFVCYDESIGYIRIQIYKTWTDAQSYCRQYHTDLATISSADEQSRLYAVVGDGPWVWIGLFLDSWQWSDQWNLFFRYWATGYTSQTLGSGDCVAMSMTNSGKWVQYSCNQPQHFICYIDVKKQIVRLNVSYDGKCNLTNTSLQTAILNELHKKLKLMGLGNYTQISWRKDENGEVFHLKSRH
nr:putative C-type lectin domain family 20 member A [Misgurnus anguillicaudatus]